MTPLTFELRERRTRGSIKQDEGHTIREVYFAGQNRQLITISVSGRGVVVGGRGVPNDFVSFDMTYVFVLSDVSSFRIS